ncbi:MAG: penicillin-binding protein 1C [Sedimentisphaerales bacterium]|nr:penicillin-binding protein 1C [Sedimentisphaerales bacterium]
MTKYKSKIRCYGKRLLQGLLGIAILFTLCLTIAWIVFPFPLYKLNCWKSSPFVFDIHGQHMLSIVSPQQQWCKPIPLSEVSGWMSQATIAVEDRRFYSHPGVDPLAVSRAAVQNVTTGRVVSGASTLTMQVCRMIEERPRTLTAKVIEAFRALQLDHCKTKDQILEIYLNMAPYGGNIRGVEAASLLYFSKHARDLNLQEAALLAGLPKSPSRYDPRIHYEAALQRSRIVLLSMFEQGMISQSRLDEVLAKRTSLYPLQRQACAPHAAWMALNRRSTGALTTINLSIQSEIEKLAQEHLSTLPSETELAAVTIDIEQSSIVAMIGSSDFYDPKDGQVNAALTRHSPGSTLKPFIYAAAFQGGRLAADSIVYDVPLDLGGWQPENFDRTYSGPVPVRQALTDSLNIPALYVTRHIGLARCYGILESAGISLPSNANRNAGLALVVGGVEISLLDLTNAYAMLGRKGRARNARLFPDDPVYTETAVLNANVCATVNEILSSRNRRPTGMEDVNPDQIPWFMWKTGTSSGRRDAWAVGHNHRYAIGVWVGRFRGTGRLAYVGAEAAEPLLAKMFQLPALRNDTDPPFPSTITVIKPIPKPITSQPDLRILEPTDGCTFIAIDREVLVHPKTNKEIHLTWFLNNRLITNHSMLRLAPGRYHLLCVAGSGDTASSNFTVQ